METPKSHLLSQMLTVLPYFSQSLLDFFNLDDSQTHTHTSIRLPNLVINGVQLWVVGGHSSVKRKFALRQLDCVACTMCQCAVLLKGKTVACKVFNNS